MFGIPTVGRNPQQPPHMFLYPVTNGMNYQPQLVQDFLHQQYLQVGKIPNSWLVRYPMVGGWANPSTWRYLYSLELSRDSQPSSHSYGVSMRSATSNPPHLHSFWSTKPGSGGWEFNAGGQYMTLKQGTIIRPICAMSGVLTYMWLKLMINV